jgi:hypothetical protein
MWERASKEGAAVGGVGVTTSFLLCALQRLFDRLVGALEKLGVDAANVQAHGPAPCGALKGRIARAPMLDFKPVVFDEFQIGDDT